MTRIYEAATHDIGASRHLDSNGIFEDDWAVVCRYLLRRLETGPLNWYLSPSMASLLSIVPGAKQLALGPALERGLTQSVRLFRDVQPRQYHQCVGKRVGGIAWCERDSILRSIIGLVRSFEDTQRRQDEYVLEHLSAAPPLSKCSIPFEI